MKADALLEQILESPRMDLYFQEIQHLFEEEQRKRQHFYETITDHDKAEFINGEMIMHSPVRLEHNIAAGFLSESIAANNSMSEMNKRMDLCQKLVDF